MDEKEKEGVPPSDPPRDPPRPPPLPFNSPERARLLSGEPTWGRSGETYAVIPDLGVRPKGEGKWQIRAWGANGVMFRAEMRREEIPGVLEDWEEDPEGTWEKLFGGKPPGIAGKAGGEGVKVKVPVSPHVNYHRPRQGRIFTEEELNDLDF